ncbi:MAG TPA: YfiR family protein [Alphaproteobacteria bacterium]|nr:YfiR family protein [Alphaproteobacteria bacterium]
MLARSGFRSAILGLLLFFAAGGPVAAQDAAPEYTIKATYLYKFGPYVSWPSGAWPPAPAPLKLCIVGTDPFGDVIDRAVRGQEVDGRAFVVRRLPRLDASSGCMIAFVSGSAAQSAAEALAAVKGEPMLTITDGAQSARDRGIINFVIRDNRVRFEIDAAAAAAAGLSISSKLQSLAVPLAGGVG